MCDGIAANDCDIISLTEYETILNDQLVKLDDHFNEIDEELKTKKTSFIEMFRNDPSISRDEEVLSLKQKIQNFNPMNAHGIPALETFAATDIRPITENKRIEICDSFSEDNVNLIVSSCKRSIRSKGRTGYCFLSHPNIDKNQILRWTLRVPRHQTSIGIVIILKNILFEFLKITFKRYWNICQPSRFPKRSEFNCLLSYIWQSLRWF